MIRSTDRTFVAYTTKVWQLAKVAIRLRPLDLEGEVYCEEVLHGFRARSEALFRFQALGTKRILLKRHFAFPTSERHVSHFNTLVYENGTQNA